MTSAQSITADQYRDAARTLRDIRATVQRATSGDVPSGTLLENARNIARRLDELVGRIAGVAGLDDARTRLIELRDHAQAVVVSRGLVTREELTRRVTDMTLSLDNLIAQAEEGAGAPAEDFEDEAPSPYTQRVAPQGNGTAGPASPGYTPVHTEGGSLPVVVDGQVRQGTIQTVSGVRLVVVSG
jgi:hypothetical protein